MSSSARRKDVKLCGAEVPLNRNATQRNARKDQPLKSVDLRQYTYDGRALPCNGL